MAGYTEWTDEETNILKENYADKTTMEMVDLFDGKFSKVQICNKANRYNLIKKESTTERANEIKRNAKNVWPDEDMKILIDNYENISNPKMFELLGGKYPIDVFRKIACGMGLRKNNECDRKRCVNKWTDEDVKILKDNYEFNSSVEMAGLLGNKFSVTAVIGKAVLMGLRKNKETISNSCKNNCNQNGVAVIWSKEDENILRNNYSNHGNVELFKMLDGRHSKRSIREKSRWMGLEHKDTDTRGINCKIDENGEEIRMYPINKDYFKIFSDDMAYILGLIAADGCLHNGRGRRVSISLHSDDKYILDEISNKMGMEGNCVYKHNRCNCHVLIISNRTIYDNLVSLGLSERKTFTMLL